MDIDRAVQYDSSNATSALVRPRNESRIKFSKPGISRIPIMLYRLFTGEVNRRWVGEPQTLVCSEVSRRSSQCIKENFSRGLQLKSSARRDLSARAYQSRNFACFLMMKKPIFEVVVFADMLPMPSTADINTAAGGGPPKRFGQLLSYRRVSLFLADLQTLAK